MRNQIFIFDRLYLTTHASSGDGKVLFFSVSIAPSCGVNNFVLEELFILTMFILLGNIRQKSRKPLGATAILPISDGTISKCVPYRSRYQHALFRTCMKNRTDNFCHLPLYYDICIQRVIELMGMCQSGFRFGNLKIELPSKNLT